MMCVLDTCTSDTPLIALNLVALLQYYMYYLITATEGAAIDYMVSEINYQSTNHLIHFSVNLPYKLSTFRSAVYIVFKRDKDRVYTTCLY